MLVEGCLASSQAARNSDKDLIIMVLERMGIHLTPEQFNTFRSISFESITRARRKFQEQGKYLPSPEVAKQRNLKSMIVQQNAPTANPNYVQKLVEQQPEQSQPATPGKAIPWMDDEE